MHILQKWIISNQDFQEGVKLLESFNGSQTWLSIFKKLGESTYTRVELHRQINQVLEEIDQRHRPQNITFEASELKKVRELPLAIKQIEEERKNNYKQANRIHFSLVLHVESMLTQKIPIVDAKTEVYKLRELFEDIDEAWKKIDEYNPKGEIPQKRDVVKAKYSIDINHAANRKRTLVTYLSPSYLKRIPEKRREKFIDETKKEIEQIENLILENEAVIHLK